MKKDQEEEIAGTVSRSFSLKIPTSETLNRIKQAEKGRPYSLILGEAITDYAEKNHPEISGDVDY